MNDTSKIEPLLEQAKNLADNLKFTFDTPTGIPDNSLFLDPPRIGNSTSNGVATTGTLILEWQRLSDLTGDPSYGELAKKAESYLINPLNPELGEPFPGLIGTDISISNGSFLDSRGGWTGGTDSYYEYLIKMYLYDPVTFADYKDKWVEAVDSSIEYLASHPTSRPDLTFLAYYRNNTDTGIVYLSQHRKSTSRLFLSSDVVSRQSSYPTSSLWSAACVTTGARGNTCTKAKHAGFVWHGSTARICGPYDSVF